MSTARGISYVQFATKDMEATRKFWHEDLRFPIALHDKVNIPGDRTVDRMIFDIGQAEYVIFIDLADCALGKRVDTSISAGFSQAPSAFHFAFDGGSPEQIEDKHAELVARGVDCTPILYRVPWVAAFYFFDPNGINLEYSNVHWIPGMPEEDLAGAHLFEFELSTRRPRRPSNAELPLLPVQRADPLGGPWGVAY